VTRWVRTREELLALAGSLSDRRALALDSESDSLHHHAEKVCLVQLARGTGDACLIDPLALGGDLSPLAPSMADPGVLKVFHGADYDVTTMKRDFGFSFAGVFDTMIAARFLGFTEIGLQAVARKELGVELTKDSQKDDWSARPLTPRQEAYALADVEHLLPLHARLKGQLEALGRLAWVEEEGQAVASLEPARRGRDPEAYRKTKGLSRLSRRQQAVFRELHLWREGRADATDVPAFKIVGSEVLLALAGRLPRTAADLGDLKGLPARIRAHPEELLEAVRRGLELPESELPRLEGGTRRPVLPEAVRRRVEALKAWRAREAARLALDASVVLPQRLLEKVAEAAPRRQQDLEGVPGLRRWRIDALGEGLVAAAGRA
jgi:ribonuclease D